MRVVMGTIKTRDQERRAMAERQANADASAAGNPLPHPNPWDAFVARPAPTASLHEILAWHRDFADRHAPRYTGATPTTRPWRTMTRDDDDKSSTAIVLFQGVLAIMGILGGAGGIIATAVKYVGVDITWTWEQIAITLSVSIVLMLNVWVIGRPPQRDGR